VVDYLQNILLAIDHIKQYLEGYDESSFLSNSLVQDAVIRNLEVNGKGACSLQQAPLQVGRAGPLIRRGGSSSSIYGQL
jgi:uncharacterized protein with HEPN domain